jgi:MtN3 and saliva related transmembrane protein
MIGLIAAILTTLSFVPQAILVLRTRQTAGISLAMYAMFTLGIAFWLVYGILRDDMPIVVANVVTLSLASLILGMKVMAVVRKTEK